MEPNPYIQEAGVEHFNNYQPGGFHPVHLGDTFKETRYTVVHKLGFGTYATVWLVRDNNQEGYASLKILSADASEYSSGTELDVLHRSATGSGPGKHHVLKFLDSFSHHGPNGKHLCIVTEVSGPSLSTHLFGMCPDGELPPDLARRLTVQVVQGLEYLHSCNIVHGDLHLGNILYHSSAVSFKSQEDIDMYFGVPETGALRLVNGAVPPHSAPHVPLYFVELPDHSLFLDHIFKNPSQGEIKICDFSESSLHDPARGSLKRTMNCPTVYASPEVIFDQLASPSSDIWALGNTMHQILTGGGTEGRTVIPGEVGCSEDEVLCEIVLLLGKLPDRWWAQWKGRPQYFDEEGRWIGNTKAHSTPGQKLSRVTADAYLAGDEKEVFETALRGIFVYGPQDRLTASDVAREFMFLK